MHETLESAAPSSSSTPRQATAELGGKAHDGIKRLSATAHKTVDRMTTAAIDSAERLRTGKIATSAQQLGGTTCAYIREHPVTAVGIAVAAGYLLSRLRPFR